MLKTSGEQRNGLGIFGEVKEVLGDLESSKIGFPKRPCIIFWLIGAKKYFCFCYDLDYLRIILAHSLYESSSFKNTTHPNYSIVTLISGPFVGLDIAFNLSVI